MQKHYSIVNNYFSLLNSHIKDVVAFNKQANNWLINADDLIFDSLTCKFFRENLISFSQKVLATTDKISNINNTYLEHLQLLANALNIIMKINYDYN